MLVGLYGGTFDPVHVGHIHAALAVGRELGLDQVRMVLAARPGHRGSPSGNAEHRWHMLCLACADHDELIADDVELRREGTSYTIDTVTDLRSTGAVPCWILGQDAFATLPVWHRWRELLDFSNLVVVSRPGDLRAEPRVVQDVCAEHEVTCFDSSRIGQIYRVNEPMLEVSATQIRKKLATGESVQDLLADPVSNYIRANRLYVTTENSI